MEWVRGFYADEMGTSTIYQLEWLLTSIKKWCFSSGEEVRKDIEERDRHRGRKKEIVEESKFGY